MAIAARARLPFVRAAARAALDLALPRVCVSCDAPLGAPERGVVCGRCWSRLTRLSEPQCGRCGHPFGRDAGRHACRWCETLLPYVRAARSVCFVHHGTGSAIVHALKYGGWTSTADEMAERMARLPWPDDVRRERALVVGVPLAAVRLRERGYNQSDLLARGVAARWGVPAPRDVLVRTRATRTQTRLTPGSV